MLNEAQSLGVLKQRVRDFPELVVVLGSGWNKVLDGAKIEVSIPYKELFGVSASVPGHEGKLVVATISAPSLDRKAHKRRAGKRVAFMQGRLHMYEGFSAREATLPIRVFAKAGMKRLVVTSAAGAINEKFRVGEFVVLSDMITLLLPTRPLTGPEFVDLSEPFAESWRVVAKRVLSDLQLPYREGVYAYVHGPNFETAADKMALKFLGADVVGMSTVPETMMAKALGVKVLGLSFVTNLAFVQHNHTEVLAAADAGSRGMVKLLEALVKDSDI